MERLGRHGKLALGGVALALIILVVIMFGISASAVPKAFSDARMQGGKISDDIVNVSNQVATDLAKVHELDARHDYQGALTLTLDLTQKVQTLRTKAVELSGELEAMSKAVGSVNSEDARQAAVDAIGDRLALISHLVNYSAYLAQLLDALRGRFLGQPAIIGPNTESLIARINAEVKQVNEFNTRATDAMHRFDAATR